MLPATCSADISPASTALLTLSCSNSEIQGHAIRLARLHQCIMLPSLTRVLQNEMTGVAEAALKLARQMAASATLITSFYSTLMRLGGKEVTAR